MERKIKRLQTTNLIRPMVDEHWESLRTAHTRGEKVAWCAGPLFMLTGAMGVPTHFMAGYGSYVAGTKGIDPLMEAAEADGHLPDTCSYHRLHLGLLALERDGLPVRDDLRLPVPDLMLCSRLCTEMSHYSDAIHRMFKVPVVPIDIPPVHSHEEADELAAYVERQIQEVAIPEIERLLGRPYDYDRLSEIMASVKKTALLREECLELTRNIPAPWTLFDIAVSIAPVMYLMGKPGTVEYYQALKAELEERVANKEGALTEEKYRLYWDHFMMWGWLGVLSRKLSSYGATMLAGRYPFMMWPHAESIEPERPVHTIAYQLMRYMVPQGGVDLFHEFVDDSITRFSLDGMIFLSSRTCRAMNMGQQDVIDMMERKYGIPSVLIDADHVDPRFYSEAQMDTRLQALFEMIDGRRRVRAG